MPVETVTTIADLNPDWPLGSDQKQFGDDHLRNIKKALKALSTGVTVLPKPGDAATGELRFYELAANGVNYIAVKAPNLLPGDFTLTLPQVQGAVGTVLTNDGSGGLYWGSPPAPSATSQIMQMSASVQLVPGLLLPLFTNPSLYAYKLIRAHCYGLALVAPFEVKVRRASPSAVNPEGIVFNLFYMNSLGTTAAVPEFERFTSNDILQIEVDSSGAPATGPAIISIAYEIYSS